MIQHLLFLQTSSSVKAQPCTLQQATLSTVCRNVWTANTIIRKVSASDPHLMSVAELVTQ